MANWLDKYDVGGNVEGSGRTPIFKSDTLTFPAHSLARYVSDDKKSRLKGTSDNGEINKAADWLTTWFSSPGAKRRFSEGLTVKSDNFTKQALQDAKDNVNNVYVLNNYSDLIDQDLFKKYAPLIDKEFEDSQKRKEEFFTSRLEDDRDHLRHAKSQAYMNELDYEIARDSGKEEGYVAGFYTPRGHMLNITKGLGVFNKDVEPGTAVHELTHASGLDDYYISFGKQILNKYPVGKSNGMGLFPMFKQPKGTTQGDKEYINHDGAYPRLMEMRYKSKINPNQVITPKQFEKIKAQNKGNDLFRYHTDHDIINMLNHFAANDNSVQSDVTQAEYGAELNYNNSSVSYPPNFVGQGYDITGRDYSSAWGGQFDNGGELPNVTVKGKRQPIIVTNPNDPRLKAYKDSLKIYNISNNKYKELKKEGSSTLTDKPFKTPEWYRGDNPLMDYWEGYKGIKPTRMVMDVGFTDNAAVIPLYKKPTQPVIYQERVYQKETPELQDLQAGLPVDISLPELQRVKGPNRITMGKPLFPGGPQTDYYTPIDEAGNVVQSADFKTSQFAMGGSMPGAVGFMYARTGAPSKGPRRNQTIVTDASAQDGIGLPFISDPKLRNTLEGNKPGLLQPGDYRLPEGRMAGSIYPSSEVSRSVGGEDGEPAYLIPSFKYGLPLQDYVGEYNKTDQYLGGPFKTWQEADAFGELRHKYIDKKYKTLPSPVKTWGDGFQNGGEMKYYQEGLDFKPKSISKNGSQLTKLDQLTNFTNYNTKQSGGWLDKYND